MGTTAARKALTILHNVINVTCIELLCTAQALDFQLPCKMGRGTKWLADVVRTCPASEVRPSTLCKLAELIRSGEICAWVLMTTAAKNL